MRTSKLFAVMNMIALAIHISFSYLTQVKLINSNDVGEISDKYPSLFTPAGFTFSIWGVIYLLLLAFTVFHLFAAFTRPDTHPANEDTRRINVWFLLNNLAAGAWLVAWTMEQIQLSLALIFFQLITLMIIHLRLNIYDKTRPMISRTLTQIPLTVYFAWITIATVANASVYLQAIGWDPVLPEITWTVIMIGASVFITALVILSRRNVVFGLVVIWALFGIIQKRMTIDEDRFFEIIRAGWLGIAIVFFICVLQIARNIISHKTHRRFPLPSHSLK